MGHRVGATFGPCRDCGLRQRVHGVEVTVTVMLVSVLTSSDGEGIHHPTQPLIVRNRIPFTAVSFVVPACSDHPP
jgi:hypothetical protein